MIDIEDSKRKHLMSLLSKNSDVIGQTVKSEIFPLQRYISVGQAKDPAGEEAPNQNWTIRKGLSEEMKPKFGHIV